MITMTLRELDFATPALRKISQTNLSAKAAFQLIKVLNVIDMELKTLDKVRYQLFEKYGQRDENGKIKIENGNVAIDKQYLEDFTREFDDLASTEVTLSIEPFSVDLISDVVLTPTEAGYIIKFIDLT